MKRGQKVFRADHLCGSAFKQRDAKSIRANAAFVRTRRVTDAQLLILRNVRIAQHFNDTMRAVRGDEQKRACALNELVTSSIRGSASGARIRVDAAKADRTLSLR